MISQTSQQQSKINIKEYSETFNLLRRKYIAKSGNKWRTVNRYLTNSLLYSHMTDLTGQAILGAFLLYATDIFSFDIDNHNNNDTDFFKDIKILTKYNYLIKNFGIPSIVYRSSKSRGLHCYYKLQNKYPFIIIKQALQMKLDRLPNGIELLPSPDHALRLPYAIGDGGLLLDNKTLQPVKDMTAETMIDLLSTIEKRHFVDIFNLYPSQFLLKAKSRKKQFKNFQALKKLELIEAELLPIYQGRTERDTKLEKLAFAYYCCGLDIEEATRRVCRHMIGAGRDYQERRIEEQLTCHYARYDRQRDKKATMRQIIRKDRQLDLFLQIKVDEFVRLSPFSLKRQTGFRKFLIELYNWKQYIENLNNQDRVYYNFLYIFFWHNTKTRKLIPLPHALLNRWNNRYIDFMTYLKQESIIELKQNYSTDLGVCNYFNINVL